MANRQRTAHIVEALDLKRLHRLDEKRDALSGIHESNAALRRAKKEAYFQNIYHSVGIEGNTMTLAQTRSILETKLAVNGKSIDEHNEILGLDSAMKYINASLVNRCVFLNFEATIGRLLTDTLRIETISSQSKIFWRCINVCWVTWTRLKAANSVARKSMLEDTRHPVLATFLYWWHTSSSGWTRTRPCRCIRWNMPPWPITNWCTSIRLLMAMAEHRGFSWIRFWCGPVIRPLSSQSNKGMGDQYIRCTAIHNNDLLFSFIDINIMISCKLLTRATHGHSFGSLPIAPRKHWTYFCGRPASCRTRCRCYPTITAHLYWMVTMNTADRVTSISSNQSNSQS